MAFNLFKKSSAAPALQEKGKSKKAKPMPEKLGVEPKAHAVDQKQDLVFLASSVLKQFHISEKASRLTALNQYTFRVNRGASKREIRKQVEKMFHVNVTSINVLTMPSKSRSIGRHVGTRSGFRKAIITLREGQTISEATA